MRGNFPVYGAASAAAEAARGEDFVRFSYSIREDEVAEALARLQGWLA